MIHLRVYGVPASQGSKKHVGNGVMVEASKKHKPWRKALVETVRNYVTVNGPFGGDTDPLFCRATFYLPAPKRSKFGEHAASSPDLDKLQRGLGDGLEKGGLITNDARIVCWWATKKWATEDEPPGVKVTLSIIGGEDDVGR